MVANHEAKIKGYLKRLEPMMVVIRLACISEKRIFSEKKLIEEASAWHIDRFNDFESWLKSVEHGVMKEFNKLYKESTPDFWERVLGETEADMLPEGLEMILIFKKFRGVWFSKRNILIRHRKEENG